MKDIIKTIWQLPQILIGIIVVMCYRSKISDIYPVMDGVIVVSIDDFPGGVCFGDLILINTLSSNKTYLHELGHSKQSQYLGPLYLLVIGLPSILHAAVHKLWCKNDDYYHFYTEKWANKLSDK